MLTPERWQRVESLFDGALDREPDVREAWLREACGDDAELLEEVRKLLQSSESAEDRFERPAAVEAAHLVVDGLRDPLEGQDLGPYHLIEPIGRGGMGVVYRAERRDGEFQQDVVVKILRVGMHDEAGRERFRRERQILAQLAHPNIARLLDGGVAPDGRPYIVMEPVDGQRIDVFCDQRQLPLRARIELFLQVIDAVQYAHQNLVIHRDLKPPNVLVTESGSDGPRVKLLDFGIAKILDEDDGATQTQQGLMTPDYASPEQVRGERVAIASDVYQLGVLLYELLTGFLPYDLKTRSLFDVSHAVCETEPAFPSRIHTEGRATRTGPLSSSHENTDPERILAARQTTSAHIRRALSGDLDGILLKALQKDGTLRYASARELGEDLRRHLEGLPVLAREGDPGYRAAKFLRRHALALVLGLGVIGVIVGSTIFHTQRVTIERNRAQLQAQEKQEIADFLVEMFEVGDASKSADHEVTAAELVERALDRVESEDRSPSVEARMLLAIGEVGNKLGLHAQLQPGLERAVVLTEQVHGRESDEYTEALLMLADNHRALRQFEDALPLLEEATLLLRERKDEVEYARALRVLAEVRRDTGDPEAALRDNEEALSILRANFAANDRDVLIALGTRAYVLRTLDRYDEAESIYREVIAGYRSLGEEAENAALATMLNNLGFLLVRRERFEEAVAAYEEATALRAATAGEDHPSTLTFRGNLVGALTRSGRYDEALEHAREVLEMKAARSSPDHWSVGQSHHSLGRILVTAGRFDEAEVELERASAIWTSALGEDHAWTAMGRLWTALARLLQGERAAYDRAVDRDLETMIAGMGNNVVAGGYETLVKVLVDNGFQSIAEEHEAFRMELRNRWGLD